MNKSVKMSALAALLASAGCAGTGSTFTYPGTDGCRRQRSPVSGYVQDARGIIVRDPFSLCWRTGYFTRRARPSSSAIPDLVPRPVAPPHPPGTAATPPPVTPPATVAAEKITFAADAFFDFDKSTLKPEGKAKLDDLVSKLGGFNLEVIIAVGHTDSIGSNAYNQKLSVRRAESVKAYLVGKGIEGEPHLHRRQGQDAADRAGTRSMARTTLPVARRTVASRSKWSALGPRTADRLST